MFSIGDDRYRPAHDRFEEAHAPGLIACGAERELAATKHAKEASVEEPPILGRDFLRHKDIAFNVCVVETAELCMFHFIIGGEEVRPVSEPLPCVLNDPRAVLVRL